MSRSHSAGSSNATSDDLSMDDTEIAARKAFLQFGDDDVRRLVGLLPEARDSANAIIDEFYAHIQSFEETRAFFRDPRVLQRVKRLQMDYFQQLTEGNYGAEYVKSRLKIGIVHQRIAMPLKSYFGMFSFYLRAVASHMFRAPEITRDRLDSYLSLVKLVFLDVSLALEADVHAREATIHAQQQVIRELSTPVLQVRDRLLIVPLIGMMDTHRARQLTEQLLTSIRSNRAKVAVIDITGVAVVDSAVANNLIQTVQACRLMGARVIVTGISAEIAQTLVRIGVDLSKLDTLGDLQEGIAEAERLLGYKVVAIDAPLDDDSEVSGGAGTRT